MDLRFALPLLVAASALTAQNWPDFRGPNRDGHAADAAVPLCWSETRNVTWKTRLPGTGWSSPVVWGNRAWLTAATRSGRRMFVVAVDVNSGEIVLEKNLFENPRPNPKHQLNSYASPTPAIEAGRVYVHFGRYGTACLDTTSGETLWERRDIQCDHIAGPGSSPILFADKLIFNMDGGDVQFVIALDKATGKTRWKTDRSVDFGRTQPDLRKAFGTPVIANFAGKPRIVSTGAHATMAYDPDTGEETWKVRHTGFSMSSRPLVGDGVVYLNTGFMAAQLIAVRSSGSGDVTKSHTLWNYRRSVPRITSPLLVDGLIYMVDDKGVATCLDAAKGERVWRHRLDGEHCASPLYANGRIYFFDREGKTTVVQPGREFVRLATNQLGSGFMATPAVIGDAFLMRTRTHLYRVETPQQSTPKTHDWSRFRGPNGTGIATAEGLPVRFGPEQGIAWQHALAPGVSSPVIAGDLVFVTGARPGERITYALDRQTGKERWRRIEKPKRTAKLDPRNHAASATPVAAADLVAVFFEDIGLLAYDHTGKKLWELPLGPFDNEYGMGASPILVGGKVVLPCDQANDSFVIAVDKATGDVAWKTPRPEAKSGHCTPIVHRTKTGKPQIVLPGSFLLDAYDAATGKRDWWVRGLSFEMKSTPVLLDGTIYINGYASPMNQPGNLIELPDFKATLAKHDADKDGQIDKTEMPKFRGARMFFGFVDRKKDGSLDAGDWKFLRAALASKNGMLAIKAGGVGDVTKANTLWSYHRSVPQLPSPLVYGGVCYLLQDQGGLVVTLNPATGKVLERGRLKDAIDNYYASPVAGDGKVYMVSESGLVTVLKQGGSLTPLATNNLDAQCRATPAIADNRLFIRTLDHLYCFGK